MNTHRIMDIHNVPYDQREETLVVAAINSVISKYRETHQHLEVGDVGYRDAAPDETPTKELNNFIVNMASHLVKELASVRSVSKAATDLSNAIKHEERWYSIDYHGGVELHDSAQEAKDSAQYNIDHAMDAYDHWPEGMERISWGHLNQFQTCGEEERQERPSPDDPEYKDWPNAEWDYIIKYVLQDGCDDPTTQQQDGE